MATQQIYVESRPMPVDCAHPSPVFRGLVFTIPVSIALWLLIIDAIGRNFHRLCFSFATLRLFGWL